MLLNEFIHNRITMRCSDTYVVKLFRTLIISVSNHRFAMFAVKRFLGGQRPRDFCKIVAMGNVD